MPDRLAVVAVPAEIDASNADQVFTALLAAMTSGNAIVVVDMTRSRFCDCAGLTILIRARKRALAQGGEMRLLLPVDGIIPRLLILTGLKRVIPSFASLEDAPWPRACWRIQP